MTPSALCEIQLCHKISIHGSCGADPREIQLRAQAGCVSSLPQLLTFSALSATALEDLSSLPQPLWGDARSGAHTHTQNYRIVSSSDGTNTCLTFPLPLIPKSLKNFPFFHLLQVFTAPLPDVIYPLTISVNPWFLFPFLSPILSPSTSFLLTTPNLTVMYTFFYLSMLFAFVFSFFWALGLSSEKIQSI